MEEEKIEETVAPAAAPVETTPATETPAASEMPVEGEEAAPAATEEQPQA